MLAKFKKGNWREGQSIFLAERMRVIAYDHQMVCLEARHKGSAPPTDFHLKFFDKKAYETCIGFYWVNVDDVDFLNPPQCNEEALSLLNGGDAYANHENHV